MRDMLDYTVLDEVTKAGASASKNVSQYKIFTFQITASDVTDGATVAIEASLDGDNWATYETYSIAADGTQMYTIASEKLKYVRANITDYTDGTYTVLAFVGV